MGTSLALLCRRGARVGTAREERIDAGGEVGRRRAQEQGLHCAQASVVREQVAADPEAAVLFEGTRRRRRLQPNCLKDRVDASQHLGEVLRRVENDANTGDHRPSRGVRCRSCNPDDVHSIVALQHLNVNVCAQALRQQAADHALLVAALHEDHRFRPRGPGPNHPRSSSPASIPARASSAV